MTLPFVLMHSGHEMGEGGAFVFATGDTFAFEAATGTEGRAA